MMLRRFWGRLSTSRAQQTPLVVNARMEACCAVQPQYEPPSTVWVDEITAGKIGSDTHRDGQAFVVIGSAQSGAALLCNGLNQAMNGICVHEPEPDLSIEARMAMEGRYQWSDAVIDQTVAARARAVRGKGLIYGEENVGLVPFVPQLAKQGFRIVVIKRDGREVVQSLINKHDHLSGDVYQECTEHIEISNPTRAATEYLSAEKDRSDYTRPRPVKSDPFHERWSSFSRLEMCAWYWARIYNHTMDELEKLPACLSQTIDYSSVAASDVGAIAEFVGLKSHDARVARQMPCQHTNSLQCEFGDDMPVRSWTEWTDDEKAQFECVAASTMMRLGYYDAATHIRFKPASYGDWWRSRIADIEWYTWMYNGRRAAHEDLLAFVRGLEQRGEMINSVLDVGCGCGVGYRESFAGRRYVGLDLSEKNIAWCREHQTGQHSFIAGDIILDQPQEKFDLVFSQGTIDNSYDVNAYLRSIVRASRKWVYLTAYRGWFPQLREHRYMWDKPTTCFYNDVSPIEVERVLRELGCTQIAVEPLAMRGDAAISSETRIVARVPD